MLFDGFRSKKRHVLDGYTCGSVAAVENRLLIVCLLEFKADGFPPVDNRAVSLTPDAEERGKDHLAGIGPENYHALNNVKL